jgi:hypothetical protein
MVELCTPSHVLMTLAETLMCSMQVANVSAQDGSSAVTMELPEPHSCHLSCDGALLSLHPNVATTGGTSQGDCTWRRMIGRQCHNAVTIVVAARLRSICLC